MIMRGVSYGPTCIAAGAMGFFGELHEHQKLMGPFKPNLDGSVFVSKTTTFGARLDPSRGLGIMPMRNDGITPKEFAPKCILPNLERKNIALSWRMFLKGLMLNTVGLSGPGAKVLFEDGRWQQRTKPFFISFMTVAKTAEERIVELKNFVALFAKHLPDFKAKVALQINYSCPNVGLNTAHLVEEVTTDLAAAHVLKIPVTAKFNILVEPRTIWEIARNHHLDGIFISNTIHWNDLPKAGINRQELFGTDISPLAEYGGGGLSGAPLLPLVANWIDRARAEGIKKPINAGGGILSRNDLFVLKEAEADGVSLGCVCTLRPTRVQGIIKTANHIFR